MIESAAVQLQIWAFGAILTTWNLAWCSAALNERRCKQRFQLEYFAVSEIRHWYMIGEIKILRMRSAHCLI